MTTPPLPDMTLDLDALEKIAKAATPGPWRVITDLPALSIGVENYRVVQTPNQNNVRHYGAANTWDGVSSDSNAAHIATFDPPTVLALIEAARERDQFKRKADLWDKEGWQDLDALRAELTTLRAQLAQAQRFLGFSERTLLEQLAQAREALEEISMTHDGNPPMSLADIPEIDYARRTLGNMRRRARTALAVITPTPASTEEEK